MRYRRGRLDPEQDHRIAVLQHQDRGKRCCQPHQLLKAEPRRNGAHAGGAHDLQKLVA